MKRFLLTNLLSFVILVGAFAQIDVTGYKLVYSSETPEAASALLNLSEDELANCTGDFMSIENLERNWVYSKKQTSTWNKRMGTTDEERAMVHHCEDGMLKLLAVTKDGTSDGFITSGVNMKQGYKYGIFEIKAKCNPHKSNFPAVWMMPVNQQDGWPNCGEIDIMEQIGTSSVVYSTVHLGARYNQPVGKKYQYSGSRTFDTSAHVYSLLWTKTSLVFYCDGKKVFQYDKDLTLDLINHPDYEKWQFPYNKEFYIILDQALGMNQSWGAEEPDPSYTYEMDVEYVRVWQAPEEQSDLEYYVLSNYAYPDLYMTATTDDLLTTTTEMDMNNLDSNAVFSFIPNDAGGKFLLQTLSGKRVSYQSATNKQIELNDEGYSYYIINDDERGTAFDYAKRTAPFTYADGSRALSLNASKGNIITTSGTSKDASWWKLTDVTSIVNGTDGISENEQANENVVRKVVRNGQLLIIANGKEYTVTGNRIK